MASLKAAFIATVALAVTLVFFEAFNVFFNSSDRSPSQFPVFLAGGSSRRGGATCRNFDSLGLYTQAESDFERYKGGLTPEQRVQYRSLCAAWLRHSCMTITILGGRIFVRHLFPGYQSRHRITLHAIYRVAQRLGPLPDTEFVIEVTDGYVGIVDLPVFMVTRRRDTRFGVLYPDFTFYSWPEAVCPPERSHAYGYLYDLFEREAGRAEAHPEEWWHAKEDTLFWRGARVHNQVRDMVVQMLKDKPAVDVEFMMWMNTSLTGVNGAPGCVGLLEHCQYRYLAFLDGNTYSSRFKFNLLCGSCVFAARQQFVEWWTELFASNEDYVEVSADWSNALQRHAEVRWSPDGGRAIAERAQRKALKFLSEDAVDCYWLRLIEKAAAVLPPPDPIDFEKLPPSTRPIEDALLFTNEIVLDEGVAFGPATPLFNVATLGER